MKILPIKILYRFSILVFKKVFFSFKQKKESSLSKVIRNDGGYFSV
jgi:hypothetical protein